jgi:NAD(P)-dependent dehydrogenase (short-subunit alcohol dehydrogenase family)
MTPVAMITGANRGIGLAFVEAHLQAGYRVFAGCRNPDRADELQACVSQYPSQLTVVQLDVTDESSVVQMAAHVMTQTSHVDRLVNNAAVFHTTPLEDVTQEKSLKSFAVNSVGAVLVFRALLPALQAGKRPIVVNVSSNRGSVSGQQDTKLWDYAASKAALNSYMRKMAFTLAPSGGLAVSIDPGWVQTRMGGAEAALTPEESVAGMIQVVGNLTADQNGEFFLWNGDKQAW